MSKPPPTNDPRSDRGPDGGAPAWVVFLIVFGIMGLGGPLLALALFFFLRQFT